MDISLFISIMILVILLIILAYIVYCYYFDIYLLYTVKNNYQQDVLFESIKNIEKNIFTLKCDHITSSQDKIKTKKAILKEISYINDIVNDIILYMKDKTQKDINQWNLIKNICLDIQKRCNIMFKKERFSLSQIQKDWSRIGNDSSNIIKGIGNKINLLKNALSNVNWGDVLKRLKYIEDIGKETAKRAKDAVDKTVKALASDDVIQMNKILREISPSFNIAMRSIDRINFGNTVSSNIKNTGSSISSAAKSAINFLGGGGHHKDNFQCDSGRCNYIELLKDFRDSNRNFVAVSLTKKNEQESRCHFPFDWAIIHAYNLKKTSHWREGSSGDWQVLFENRCNADFRILRQDGEVHVRKNQGRFINLDDFLGFKYNVLDKLSNKKFSLIKNMVWGGKYGFLRSNMEGFQNTESNRNANPNQFDNLLQDAFIVKLATDKKFFTSYMSIADDMANAFIQNFVAVVTCIIVKTVYDGKTTGNNDVRNMWVIRYYGPNPNIKYYRDMVKHLRNSDNFKHIYRFREDSTPIMDLRSSGLLSF